jgi:hypothetical protein
MGHGIITVYRKGGGGVIGSAPGMIKETVS